MGILCTNFLIFWWKFCDMFLSIFRKTYEKYLMVSVPFKNVVITLCIMTALNISSLQISWCFNFYRVWEDSRVRLCGHKEKSIGSKTITKIINGRVVSLSLSKIVKIYHIYNIFLISDSHFDLQLGYICWRIHC